MIIEPTPRTLLGYAEIADLLGVKPQTVRQWRFRGILPDPDQELSARPAWRWATIRRWAEATGRRAA